MIQRRALLAASGLATSGLATSGLIGLARPALAQRETPGVTASEIKFGNTNALSGPASAYGMITRTTAAYFRMMNEEGGGIAGRRLNYIYYDDGYVPSRTVEAVRRLVEQDRVAFLFNTLGTATNSAIVRYANGRRVPHLFLATGADKWGNYRDAPWTIGWQPSYRTEAQIYAKHLAETKPDAKLAVLFQNDDFGKDYLAGLRDVMGGRFDAVRSASYEVTDPTVDSQIISLQGGGADALVIAATPKFAAQAIRKVYEIGWRPQQYLTNVSLSVAAVMNPAGPERGVGVITSAYLKEEGDPAWRDDAGMNEFRAFMRRWFPEGDMADSNTLFGFGVARTMHQVLRQCGDDFSRENVMRQATGLNRLELPVLLPGITVSSSPTNYHPIRHMQLQRWTGSSWERFGGVIEGANVEAAG